MPLLTVNRAHHVSRVHHVEAVLDNASAPEHDARNAATPTGGGHEAHHHGSARRRCATPRCSRERTLAAVGLAVVHGVRRVPSGLWSTAASAAVGLSALDTIQSTASPAL